MCSKNFVPRVIACASFLLAFSFTAAAQTHLVGEAWKTSKKPSSETTDKTVNVTTASAAEAVSKNQSATISSAWLATKASVAPAEPNISPANPPLTLEAEVAVINPAKLNVNPETETLVGIEPPATFHATAYSLRGKTRAGTGVRRGVIAADPRVLPLGSIVHLKAGDYSGLYTVRDTGGSIKGKRIDVWMPSSREARSFGRQNVRLTVMKYGGGRKPKTK